MTTDRLDLFKLHKDEYVKPKRPTLVETTSGKYLTITGKGEPGGTEFQERLGALYAVAYTIRMAKKRVGNDYKVCGLEGLWWGGSFESSSTATSSAEWNWKLIIRTPGFVAKRDVTLAVASLLEKDKSPLVREVVLETIREGLCVQMLHVGPYRTEGETVAKMMEFIEERGLKLHGVHHEIYISDPRRVPEERLRTILRYPVR
jgi:hypothetical protein